MINSEISASAAGRTLFAHHALHEIPKLLTLLDRNPHSPTYGCFDRNFWHYRIIDFPSGMAQEFVWPLALIYATPFPGNDFFGKPALREWVHAGIRFAMTSAHRDASCDDYFPFERASGAAAFSLLACIESYALLNLEDEDVVSFFTQRADWLVSHDESGRLSNHQALIILCVERLAEITGSHRWQQAARKRLDRLLSWQSREGWFPEYEGCDPGYHTLTVSLLARLYDRRPEPGLKDSLRQAVVLAREFLHPDGSFGGEYGSRNTYNFFPHGFELVGRWLPEALEINNGFLHGMAAGKSPCYSDDHIIGHHLWNYLLAYRDFISRDVTMPARPTGRVWLKEAGILIDRREKTEIYLALNKGGVFKCFRDSSLMVSDTQFSLRTGGRRERTAVAHLMEAYDIDVAEDSIRIAGEMGWAKQTLMTTSRLLLLRLVMLLGGRFFPNMIRRLLQAMLITGKKKAPYRFIRTLSWEQGCWRVSDEISARSWKRVQAIGLGADQTSIYVVMSRTYQPGQLQSWRDLTPGLAELKPGETFSLERKI
ncbi:MAG: hypothetical protein ACU84H_03180 [Gammaproteobacteria bacterium]